MRLLEVDPDQRCDRCDHASKYHAGPERGSGCMLAVGPGYTIFTKHATVTGKAKACFCDGFVPSGVSR